MSTLTLSCSRSRTSVRSSPRFVTTYGTPERAVDRQQRLGVGEVRLRHAEQGLEAGVVGRDQGPVDQPRAGLGVGERGDHDELVGVGDDDPFDGVVVVGRAAQDRAAFVDRDDARERAVVAGDVPDDAYDVADDHALATERTRLHRGDDARPSTER